MTRTTSAKPAEAISETIATTTEAMKHATSKMFDKEAYQAYTQSLNAQISETRHVLRQAYKAQMDLFLSFLRAPGFEQHVDALVKAFKLH